MDQLSGLMHVLFKKDTSDKTVFYPWSIFGNGFIVPAESNYQQIRHGLKKMMMFLLSALLITIVLLEFIELNKFQILFNIALPAIILSIFVLCYYVFVKKITKGMAISNEHMKRVDIYNEMAKSYSVPALILIEIFFFVFLIISVWFIFIREYIITASLATLFLGLCCYIVKNIIAKKIQQLK